MAKQTKKVEPDKTQDVEAAKTEEPQAALAPAADAPEPPSATAAPKPPPPGAPPPPSGASAPRAPAAPAPPSGAPPSAPALGAATPAMDFAIESGVDEGPQKILIYGTGGVGKTSLAAMLPNPLFLDVGDGSRHLDVKRISPRTSTPMADWNALRAALRADALYEGIESVVIDTFTEAEPWAVDWMLQNVKHEKGYLVSSIEGYGFGKGYQHKYDTILSIKPDLERHLAAGRNVCLVCHNSTANVPNPAGEDWIRHDLGLMHMMSEKRTLSVRNDLFNWADHVLFVGYDVHVEDGRATGGGTRTIYSYETPYIRAKSRNPQKPMVYTIGDAQIWRNLNCLS